MRWTCPKCGKKLEISNEQLIANDGLIVCPQCLLQSRQPIPTARVSARLKEVENDSTPPPRRSGKSGSDSPPPHKNRQQQARTSYRYTGMGGGGGNTRKNTTRKKSKKKKKGEEMSALGCLGRTVVFTLVLFAVYVIFGLILEAMQ